MALTETQLKVLNSYPDAVDYLDKMNQRTQDLISHKYESCFRMFKAKWDPILAERNFPQGIPTDPDKYAELVFSQHEFKAS